MIDTKELRRLAQAALIGPDGVSLNWLKLLQDFQKEATPAVVSKLLDRLEAAEKERDALRARIAAMEQQEPVAWRRRSDYGWSYKAKPVNGLVLEPLYLAPGAQPAPSVPLDLITDYLVSISAHVAHQDDPKAQAEIGELLRMLAAAPEAKP